MIKENILFKKFLFKPRYAKINLGFFLENLLILIT